jgi:DNA-binding transcriptional LysR family regulator
MLALPPPDFKLMDYFAALRTFVRAAELKSFSRVAAELSIKTSTASRHIAELEADLRIALFNRSTRGLSLTEGGSVFYASASQVLLELEEARAAASSLNLRPAGVLRVTLPHAFGRKHVMPHIGEFLAQYPDIDVDAVFTDDTINLIEARIDLGIRIGPLTDSPLMARRLAPHRRIACASAGYVRSHGLPETPTQLQAHRCLRFSRTSGDSWYAVAKDVPDAAAIKIATSGRFCANDSEALLDAALAGLGVAVLPTWLTYAPLESGRLVNVLPAWDFRMAPEEASIWAVYPRKKTVSSKVRSFIDFLVQRIGEPPYWEAGAPKSA